MWLVCPTRRNSPTPVVDMPDWFCYLAHMARKTMTLTAALCAAAISIPAAAYPPPDSVDVSVENRIVKAKSKFSITVANVMPNTRCSVLFNKKRSDCSVTGKPYKFTTELTAPSTKGKFRIVASVPADGEYGRSDSTFVYVPYTRTPAVAKRGRDYVASVAYIPEDTEVSLTVNGATQATDYADEGGSVTGLTWTPDEKGTFVVKLWADGSEIFSRSYRVR